MKNKQIQPISIFTALFLVVMISLSGCGSFSAGVPKSFVGYWTCEDTASDGKTDTSYYVMEIENNGSFSIYDVEAGNPGISGKMGNDNGKSIECKFDRGEFDVPSCWTIDSSRATFEYEISNDTLKLCHNNVWMIFHTDQ